MLHHEDTFEMLPKQIQSTPKKYNSSPLGIERHQLCTNMVTVRLESVGQLEQKLSHKIISTLASEPPYGGCLTSHNAWWGKFVDFNTDQLLFYHLFLKGCMQI